MTNGLPFGSGVSVIGNRFGGGMSNDVFDSLAPSIAVDKDNIPVIAWESRPYQQNARIYVERWIGNAWQEVNDAGASPVVTASAQDPSESLEHRRQRHHQRRRRH